MILQQCYFVSAFIWRTNRVLFFLLTCEMIFCKRILWLLVASSRKKNCFISFTEFCKVYWKVMMKQALSYWCYYSFASYSYQDNSSTFYPYRLSLWALVQIRYHMHTNNYSSSLSMQSHLKRLTPVFGASYKRYWELSPQRYRIIQCCTMLLSCLP